MIDDRLIQVKLKIRTDKRRKALCKAIALNIRYYRAKRGMSQHKLATELGIDQSTVARYEQETYSRYTVTTLNRLATVLKVSVSQLVRLDNPRD